MKITKYQQRIINELLSNVKSEGYKNGFNAAKNLYAKERGGTVKVTAPTNEEIKKCGVDLIGWCECGKPINGRWSSLISYCPWCGKIIERE